jgi:hypothetical protein
MDAFITKLTNHAEHIKRVGHLCVTEETTKQALILPMLDILGFNAYDPTRVKVPVARMQYGTIICQNIPAFALTLPTPVFYTGYGTEVSIDSSVIRAHACSAGYAGSSAEKEALGRSKYP